MLPEDEDEDEGTLRNPPEVQMPHKSAWEMSAERESAEVRALGERMGFGALMHYAESEWRAWNARHNVPLGAEHSHYCCVSALVTCPCREPGAPSEQGGSCDWCCGAGRVTKRVAEAIAASRR